MKNKDFLSIWIKRFLLEHLVTVKNFSRNTQSSYRDTFKLFIPFVSKTIHKPVDRLTINDISPLILKEFLSNLEEERKCSIITRNQRLAAIRSFAKFVSLYNPEYIEWYRQVNRIPFKKSQRTLITYLEKAEMDFLLNTLDRTTQLEERDYILLLFLYNTGARADEVAQLTIENLDLSSNQNKNFSSVLINGKGRKLRRCPLWDKTVKELFKLIEDGEKSEHVFLNRYHQPITRFGIYASVRRCVKKAIKGMPSLNKKHISPHTIRHTTATHLLRAGVDINTIRVWLGHVSINTTNIYAEIDLEMTAKALACCEIKNIDQSQYKHNSGLIQFLNTL